jgi:hypothetical protein
MWHTTHCQMKDTGRGTVWHFAMWNTMVVLPYGALSCCTGRGTIWRIVKLQSYGTTTSVFQLAMCYAVPQPVYFTWQCVMWYQNQCRSPNTLPGEIHSLWYHMTHCQLKYTGCGTAWHIVRWNTLVAVPHNTLPAKIHPQPMYFTWQCAMRYYKQCISPGNVLCGTTTSVFHLAMYHTLPQQVPFIWQCVLQYHDKCLSPGNVTYGALVVVPYGVLSSCTGCGTVRHIARWKALVVVMYDTLPCARH